MEYVQAKRIYYIDSSQRVQGTSSNFSIEIDIPLQNDYTDIVVLECIIPVSYYLVNDTNNTFILQEPGAADVIIAIPKGNYNINSYCVIVQGLFNSYSLHGWNYQLTYNKGFDNNFNGIITITVSNNSNIQPSITIPANSTIIEQFGFGSISSVDQTFHFNLNILQSSSVCNFVNEPCIIIHSSLADNAGTDVLQAVYEANSYQLSQISYQATEANLHSKKLKETKSKLANFSLTDINNKPINLNGQDWTMTLVVFRKESFADWIKTFIKTIVTSQ